MAFGYSVLTISAAVLMVEALYIAATYDKEQAVCDYLAKALTKHQLTLSHLQQQFIPDAVAALPPIQTQQHSLETYDQLLSAFSDSEDDKDDTGKDDNSDSKAQPLSTVEWPAQAAQTHQHAYPLGS